MGDGCSPLRSKPAAHPAGGLGCWRSIGKEEVREVGKREGAEMEVNRENTWRYWSLD